MANIIVEIEDLDEELEFPEGTSDKVIQDTVKAILDAKNPKKEFLKKAKQFALTAPLKKQEPVDTPPPPVVLYDTKTTEVFGEILSRLEKMTDDSKTMFSALAKMHQQQEVLLRALTSALDAEKEFVYDKRSGLIVGSKRKKSSTS